MTNSLLDSLPATALVLLIGPAGSGKSTLSASLPADAVVSLDALRRTVCGDAGAQGATAEAVRLQDEIVRARLGEGLLTVLDSTNVEVAVRARYVAMARHFGRPVAALVLATDLATCLARNARRVGSSRVPEGVLRWQHALAAEALTGLAVEGFSKVFTISGTPTNSTGS
jgi:predicted kinase